MFWSPVAAVAAPPSWGWSLHQGLDHHQRIDIAQPLVSERPRQGADDLKTVAPPARDAGGVRAHHQVELHAPEPQPPGHLQGVLAEAAADSLAPALFRDHVAGIGQMGAEG